MRKNFGFSSKKAKKKDICICQRGRRRFRFCRSTMKQEKTDTTVHTINVHFCTSYIILGLFFLSGLDNASYDKAKHFFFLLAAGPKWQISGPCLLEETCGVWVAKKKRTPRLRSCFSWVLRSWTWKRALCIIGPIFSIMHQLSPSSLLFSDGRSRPNRRNTK